MSMQRHLALNATSTACFAQNVKGSLLEMKKSFSPILGSFQTKMNAMNAKTEKFTSKLQLQVMVALYSLTSG